MCMPGTREWEEHQKQLREEAEKEGRALQEHQEPAVFVIAIPATEITVKGPAKQFKQ